MLGWKRAKTRKIRKVPGAPPHCTSASVFQTTSIFFFLSLMKISLQLHAPFLNSWVRTFAKIENKNLTSNFFTFSRKHAKSRTTAARKVLRTVVCYSFSHETFIFSGRKSGVWVHLIRACTTGSDPGAPSNHAKHAIFKVWNEGIFFWTWIDRLHFNLQKLDNSLNFGGAWEPVSVMEARIK